MLNWIRNASVTVKVALAPGLAIACLAMVGAIGFIANERLSESLITLGDERVPRIVAAAALSEELASIHATVNQSLAWEGAGYKEQKIAELDKKIMARLKAYGEQVKALGEANLDEAQGKHLAAAAVEFDKYQKNAKYALDIKTGMVANAASYMTTMDEAYGKLSNELSTLVNNETAASTASVAAGRSLATRNKVLILGAFGLALLATVAIAWFMAGVIVRPLTEASVLAHAVAGGDLSQQPSNCSSDATGQVLSALGEVSMGLSAIFQDIRRSAETVNLSSSEIATGTMDLSARTESTAASLEQTAASIEQLSATIRNSADNARQADVLARDASQVAREGGTVVGDVITTMEAINAQAKKIGEIIGVIDSIAFQTNILALNAAVEAARAGEQGRGFSVVASEVRTLAQRSADAAKEIRTLIQSSVDQIGVGAKKVQVAGDTMTRIVNAIEKVSHTVGEISQATSEQAGGISQVNDAVADMDRSTQQNAALVEQATAATETLKNEAQNLVGMLSRFRTAA
ncbi:MAG: methyl-accepting chemotaxis protein [Burkholderiales bacterium]